MLAIILALASAIGYGGSDFAAGLASRTASVIQVTLLACVTATVVVLVALPFAAAHRPSGASLAWGAAAGAGGAAGAEHAGREAGEAENEAGGQSGRPAAGVAAGLSAGSCFALLLSGLN